MVQARRNFRVAGIGGRISLNVGSHTTAQGAFPNGLGYELSEVRIFDKAGMPDGRNKAKVVINGRECVPTTILPGPGGWLQSPVKGTGSAWVRDSWEYRSSAMSESGCSGLDSFSFFVTNRSD